MGRRKRYSKKDMKSVEDKFYEAMDEKRAARKAETKEKSTAHPSVRSDECLSTERPSSNFTNTMDANRVSGVKNA